METKTAAHVLFVRLQELRWEDMEAQAIRMGIKSILGISNWHDVLSWKLKQKKKPRIK